MATATPSLKDRLKEVREDISALRDERAEAEKERRAAQEAFAGQENLSKDSDEFQAAKAAVAKVGEIDDKIADRQAVEVGILEMLGQTSE